MNEIKATAPTREEMYRDIKRLREKVERYRVINEKLRAVVRAKRIGDLKND